MWAAVERRSSDSADHLVAAQAEAETLGDPEDGTGFNLLGFGPTNVRLWQMNFAVEMAAYINCRARGPHAFAVNTKARDDCG